MIAGVARQTPARLHTAWEEGLPGARLGEYCAENFTKNIRDVEHKTA